jgi:hypothetical protein
MKKTARIAVLGLWTGKKAVSRLEFADRVLRMFLFRRLRHFRFMKLLT